jgi:hypothetical protein
VSATNSLGIRILLGLALCSIAPTLLAEPSDAAALPEQGRQVTTFNSIGLYWTPPGAPAQAPAQGLVKIQYAKTSETTWTVGHDLWYDSRTIAGESPEARGSIVMLEPATAYVVKFGTLINASGNKDDPANIQWIAKIHATTWADVGQTPPSGGYAVIEGTTRITTLPSSKVVQPYNNFSVSCPNHGICYREAVLVCDQSGNATAWTVYDFTNTGLSAVQPDPSSYKNANNDNVDRFAVVINGHHIILRGLTIKGGQSAIFIEPGSHDILIDNNDISDFSRTAGATFFLKALTGTTTTYPEAINEDAGIQIGDPNKYGDQTQTKRLIIQRNRIHNPRYGANPWEFDHPSGASGMLMYSTGGNHVIRYNEFYSTKPDANGADTGFSGEPDFSRFFEDAGIMGGDNFANVGSPGPDSDVYQNILMHGMDDGMEAEGGGMNVRVWGNYVDYTATGLASTVVAVGPLYLWRNVYNRSRARYDVEWGSDIQTGTGRLGFFKAGSDPSFGGGKRYVYHNTALQYPNPNGKPCDSTAAGCPLGADYGMNGTADHDAAGNTIEQPLTNTVSRNNIFDVAKWPAHNAINVGRKLLADTNDDFDYDVSNTAQTMGDTGDPTDPNLHHPFNETNGKTGNPIVYKATNGPQAEWRGLYQLDTTSPGYHDGVAIANFNSGISGSIDRGAHQTGEAAMLFGRAAAVTPLSLVLDAGSDSGPSNVDNVTNDSTPTFTGSATAGATVQIFDGTTQIGSVTAAANGTYSITIATALAQGSHSITARAGSAQSQPLTLTIDTAAPSAASITAPLNGNTVSGTTTTVSASTDATGVFGVQFKLDNVPLMTEDTTSPYSITWDTTTATNGSHTLTAVARDAAGNSIESPAVTVTVSNGPAPLAAPSTPDLAAASDTGTSNTDNLTNASTPTFTGTATAGTAVNIFSDGAQVGSGPITSGTYSVTLTTALADGTHSITAKATDGTNMSGASGALSVVEDRTPPATSVSAPPNGATVSGTVAVTASAADSNGVVGVQFQLDGAALQAEDTASPYSISWDTTTAANGSHTLTAVGRDVAGNALTSAPVSVTVNNGTSPELNVSITPQNTSVLSNAAGEEFDVTASAAQGLTSVKFYINDVLKSTVTTPPYTFSFVTAGQAPGNYALKVEASDGTSTRVETRSLTVIAATCDVLATPAAAPQGTPIQLQGVCSGSKNVAEIQFLIDDVPVASDPSSTYTATIDTSRLSVGTHTVTAMGNFVAPAGQSSASRTIDVQTPTLSVDLTPGPVVLYDEKITFSAAVTDGRQVKQVDFWLDGTFKAGTIAPPYEFTWTPSGLADLGRHTMLIQATDAGGNVISTTRDVLLTPHTCSVELGNSRYRQAGFDTVQAGTQKVVQGTRVSVRSECSGWFSINRLEFYLNGTLQSTSTDAPYAWSVDTGALTVGQTYTISTKGYLTNGLVSNDAVTIEIVAP